MQFSRLQLLHSAGSAAAVVAEQPAKADQIVKVLSAKPVMQWLARWKEGCQYGRQKQVEAARKWPFIDL